MCSINKFQKVKNILPFMCFCFALSVTTGFSQVNRLEQKISFEADGQSLQDVLIKITGLSQVRFSYSKEEMPTTKVQLSIHNESVRSVLNNLCATHGLEYREVGELIAIRKLQNLHRSDFSVRGIIVDAESNQPLAFASVLVAGKAKGTITNTSGEFVLRLPGSYASDTLMISMMGYQPVKMTMHKDAPDITIKMKSQPVILNEIEFTGSKITVQDIFREIKARVKINYPVTDHAMECFYREIKKDRHTYQSLLEAALVIRDKGYDHPKSPESVYIREIRGSSRFINRFSDFWQTNNLLRETLGLNAVRHPAATPDIFGKDQYQLHGISVLNEREVYVLVSDIKPDDCWQRTLYVDVETYAVYRSEEVIRNFTLSWKVDGHDSVYMRLTKGTSVFDFKTYDGKLYLNHIRHEVENEYFNMFTNEVLDRFTIINDLLVNDVFDDVRAPLDGLKKMGNYALESQVTPYNKEFWEHYNSIRRTPLEVNVMKDLMEREALDDQFVKSGATSEKSKPKKKDH
jgi:hypothetical protein